MACLTPITIKVPGKGYRPQLHYIDVPCGHCPACLKKRQNDWSIRIEKETDYIVKNGGSCYFITVTYEDHSLPIDEETGCVTLSKPDAQKFIETLKRRILYYKDTKIRYYLCGEYGDQFSRPHYHAMIWLPGLQITAEELRPFIEDSWSNGLVLGVHPFSTQLAQYVAKYSTKQYGTNYDGMQPPFGLMSLKPAIGSHWISDNRDFYLKNEHPFLTDRTGVRYSLPRYFRSRVYTLEGYQNYVDQCISQHDLKLQCKLDFYPDNSFYMHDRMANQRFIELFWKRLNDKRKLF